MPIIMNLSVFLILRKLLFNCKISDIMCSDLKRRTPVKRLKIVKIYFWNVLFSFISISCMVDWTNVRLD